MLYEEVLEKGHCTAISTDGMSEAEWLEHRRKGIGGKFLGYLFSGGGLNLKE